MDHPDITVLNARRDARSQGRFAQDFAAELESRGYWKLEKAVRRRFRESPGDNLALYRRANEAFGNLERIWIKATEFAAFRRLAITETNLPWGAWPPQTEIAYLDKIREVERENGFAVWEKHPVLHAASAQREAEAAGHL